MAYSLNTSTVVAVIGAGSMGAGIAQLAAQSGHSVRLFDTQPGASERALLRIEDDLAGAVKRGKLDAAESAKVCERLTAVDRIETLEGCGLAVEAIVEKLDVKQALFKQLELVLGEHAVLATNTSSISITAVAQALTFPQRLIGWHFFNPATRMKLVEVICGVETDPALAQEMHTLGKAWGKSSVDAPNAPGFIVNRVARPYYAEGLRLLGERIAAPQAIDKLLREAGGFALGPFELIDLIGADVNLSVTESVFEATGWDSRYAPNLIQQELVRAGCYGRKRGRGFYDYRNGAKLPAVDTVLPAANIAPVLVADQPATAAEIVAIGRLPHQSWLGRPNHKDRAIIQESLAVVGLADRADVDVSTLSGGQQRRVLIARALAAQPDVLIMDEPTAGVDLASQEVLSQVLARLAGRGATMLIVTHELRALRGVLTRIVGLEAGRVIFDGTSAEHDRWHGDPTDGDPHQHDGHHDDDGPAPTSPAAGPLDHVSGGHHA